MALQLRVLQDPNPTNPVEWGNDDVFLEFDHRQFYVPAPKDLDRDKYEIFWVSAHIHGGVTLCLGRRSGWDISHGKVFVRKDAGWHCTTEEVAESLLVEWNAYLSGDVWGYEIIQTETCSCCGRVSEEVIDSCWEIYDEQEAHAAGAAALEKLNQETREVEDVE